MKIKTAREMLLSMIEAMESDTEENETTIMDLRNKLADYLSTTIKPSPQNWGKVIKNTSANVSHLKFLSMDECLDQDWFAILEKDIFKREQTTHGENISEDDFKTHEVDYETDLRRGNAADETDGLVSSLDQMSPNDLIQMMKLILRSYESQ